MDERDLARRLARTGPGSESEPPDVAPAAAAAGLVDVAYVKHDSPLGPLLLAGTSAGLVCISYLDARDGDEAQAQRAVLADLALRVSPRVLAAPRALEEPRRELDQYFAGRRRSFSFPLDMRLAGGFARRILQATARIPYGATLSYGQVAEEAGSPRAFRAAGTALGKNPLPIVVPCHRVLHAGGGLGGYTGGVKRKRALLEVEGALGARR